MGVNRKFQVKLKIKLTIMKLNNIYILASMLLLLALGSGKKYRVDTKPNGNPTTAFFWKSEDDVDKGLAAMYTPMESEATWGRDFSGTWPSQSILMRLYEAMAAINKLPAGKN